MTLITDCRLILFILVFLVFWQTDANVNIVETGTKTGEASFECGTELVLTCQIDVYSSSMSWQNDSSFIPLAECIGSVCSVDPTVAGLYNISANTSAGIFNLTITQVTLENNGTSYMCAHGLTSNSSLVIVKDYEPTVNESIPGIIEVSSGCIDQSTKVEFKWEKVKNADAGTESGYEPTYITESVNITMCTGYTNCEPSYFVKKTRSIMTVPGGDDDYRLRAILNYDGFLFKSGLTNGIYKIEGGSPCEIPCDIVCKLLIACGVLLVVAVIVGLCLLLYMILRPKGKEDNTEDKWSTSTHEILLHTFSAVLWIVIVSLFICLAILCNSEDTCDCCVELPLGIVFGILFFIHLVLWFILLYSRTGKEDNEGDIHFKTKLEKVRIIFSTIPLVGLFPVCGWLIRIYCCKNCTIHKEQLTTEKKKNQLPSVTNPTNTKTEVTRKQNSQRDKKERQKQQAKIHQYVNQAIGSSEKDDQVSTSDVKPIETDTVEHSRSSTSGENSTKRKAFMKADSEANTNKQKRQKENSVFTNSGTKQPSHNNGNVITSSPEHNIEHKMNVSDNQNHVTYSEEKSQRKVDVAETKTRSENKPGSKDDAKREKRKSRKAEDENKNPRNTNMVHAEAHYVNIDVTSIGSEDKLGSSDNENPSNSSMPGKALPRIKESRKGKDDNKNPRNTKPGNADSRNGSETKKRALSANFHDEEDATTTVSIDSSTNL